MKEYSDNCRNILHIGKVIFNFQINMVCVNTYKIYVKNEEQEGNKMPDKGKSKSGSTKKGDKKGEKKKDKKK